MKVGDTVKLKSGGPVMVIQSINTSDGRALCSWFTELNTQSDWRFALAGLVPWPEGE